MASNINSDNIDGSYPIAGQDNDSQGFRNNFTNIKTNLQYAKNEISVLQSTVSDVQSRLDPIFLATAEDIETGASASLLKTTSYFSTGASNETATLAAGGEGQIKTFVMKADGGGNMVITVSNAGWKSSGTGTITFDDIGDSVIMQYISAKWFVLGNNGCTLA